MGAFTLDTMIKENRIGYFSLTHEFVEYATEETLIEIFKATYIYRVDNDKCMGIVHFFAYSGEFDPAPNTAMVDAPWYTLRMERVHDNTLYSFEPISVFGHTHYSSWYRELWRENET